MQVGVDVKCINTNFGGRDLSGFGDIATLKTANFPFRPMGYSPWVERENWLFLKVAISPKPERLHPLKLVCMYVTSAPTCMIFFELILSN